MTNLFAPINPAEVCFDTHGTPESELFGDIYFSRDNGCAESHYVFIAGNQLAQRFHASRMQQHWVVAETGFGTGLNFLLCASVFLQHAPATAQLHFVSFEKFPLQANDLQRALAALFSTETALPVNSALLTQLAEKLQQHYPTFLGGCHRSVIHPRITLDLHFGDVLNTLPMWAQQHNGQVNAWFLDGFAPSKNPAMWQPALYRAIAVSMAPAATLATFTATGHVRRGLQAVGIAMQRVAGFGHKREMLVGSIHKLGMPLSPPQAPKVPQEISIIGDGIAAASLLYALRNAPQPLRLISAAPAPASGASGNPQGAVYPLLQADWTPTSDFYSRANDFAVRLYRQLAPEYCHFTGVQQLLYSSTSLPKIRAIISKNLYPQAIWQPCTQAQASASAGIPLPYPSVLLGRSGWVQPAPLVTAIINWVECYRSQHGLATHFHFNHAVSSLQPLQATLNTAWQVHSEKGSITSQHVIIAAGANSSALLPQPLVPIRPVRGQITQLQVPTEHPLQSLRQVICHSGYLTPTHNNHCCIGATFDKYHASANLKPSDDQENIAQQEQLLQFDFSSLTVAASRAGVRATTPDHLPLVGRVPYVNDCLHATPNHQSKAAVQQWQNLWLLSGLGARGLTSAPLAAEMIASELQQRPQPVTTALCAALAPSRFAERALKRGQSPLLKG